MAGLSYSNETDWVYENPGSGEFLLVEATTLTDLPESKSVTGIAFYQSSYNKCFDLPDTKEIWIKFDVFNGYTEWAVCDEGWNLYCSGNYLNFGFWNHNYDDEYINLELEVDKRHTFILHMIFGVENSVIELGINGKIAYSYTGNLPADWRNFGDDYGNIFMYSNSSDSLFSNITISNVEISGINLSTVATGDLLREITRGIAVDLLRKVGRTESVQADSLRQTATYLTSFDCVIKPLTKIFATCIPALEKASADLLRKINKTELVQADTLRQVQTGSAVPTVAEADTFLKINKYETSSADTICIVKVAELTQADTFRKVTTKEIAIADLNRAIREIAGYDTFRKVTHKEKAVASTVIRVPHFWTYFVKPALSTAKLLADNQPSLVNTFKSYGITAVDITLSERTLSDNFTFQIAKPVNINDHVQGTLLDYHFNFLVEETTQTDLITEVKGRYSQDDLLYTWFLIDSAAITVSGTEYEVPGGRIEKGKHGSVVLLYPKAIEIITRVAEYFGLTADVKIDDFTPSNLQGDEMITYHDLLNSVFGWTSKVPQRQINLFIRGNTLHCIQRGKESSVFDITDLPHSRPTISKKFNRVLCHNPNHTSYDDDSDDRKRPYSGPLKLEASNMYVVYEYKDGRLVQELSGITTTDEDGKTVTHKSNTTYAYTSFSKAGQGQSKLVDTPDGNATVYVEYDYDDNTEWYVKSKSSTTYAIETEDGTTTVTETNTTTNYEYKTTSKGSNDYEVYLCFDKEVTTKKEYEQGHPEKADEERDIRETYYAPMGNGFYAQTVYLNGKPQGANISMGKPGNSVSQYTVDQFQETFVSIAVRNNPTELSLIVDSSVPVRDADTKNAVNNALRWLHRKVQETVSVDLISPVNVGIPAINHIVDFTERIKLDGNEYFLVSNKITFTPRKLIQKLELIRWY